MYLMKDIKELDRTGRWNPTFHMLHLDTRKDADDLTTTAARLPQNRSLNRYRDVLPYDQTRVLLKTTENDYINANYVEVPKVNRKYILTQGPLPSTSQDFWRMVWENESKGVIMLNRIVEKNVIKCHPYWPLGEDEEVEFGDFIVANYSCQMRSSYIIRELLLTNSATNENRLIKQFHFVTWPDFGVPSEPESFLEFLDEIKTSGILDSDAPPIVHCSAGIGRSGTFCLVDAALELAILTKSRDEIDPHQMLLALRRYRCGLVQTAEQLRFANIAILYGIYALFPEMVHDDDMGDNEDTEVNPSDPLDLEDEEDDDFIPPPLPPRKRKEDLTPESIEKNQIEQIRKMNELESSEGSSDEEIINLSEESSEEDEEEENEDEDDVTESSSSFTQIVDRQDTNSSVNERDKDYVVLPRDTVTDKNLNIDTAKESETSELRRRNIQERKNKTKELVDSIKKKMDDTENRYVPNYIWKYAGIAIGVGSLLYLAYQLNS